MTIEKLLEEKIGLSIPAIGPAVLERVIRARMAACGFSDPEDWLAHVRTSPDEWDILIEQVTIPETWFFRNIESFEFLVDHLRDRQHSGQMSSFLRILSIPCSGGEEPYSIAMILADMGLDSTQARIDAADISRHMLERSGAGIYGPESFRYTATGFRERYFDPCGRDWCIRRGIRDMVHFFRGNLLDRNFLEHTMPYDIIFCRNLLIYFSASAKKRAVSAAMRLLVPDGILFTGHAEQEFFISGGFRRIPSPRVFACRKIPGKSTPSARDFSLKYPVQNLPENPVPEFPPVRTPFLPPRSGPPSCQLHDGRTLPEKPSEKKRLEAARLLADQGELDKALTLCQDCLQQHPGCAGAWFLAGVIYRAQTRNQDAENCLNRAVYLEPDHHEALWLLALLAEQQENHRKAQHLRRRAHRALQKDKRE